MTVKELIDQLSQLDPELLVQVCDEQGWYPLEIINLYEESVPMSPKEMRKAKYKYLRYKRVKFAGLT